MTKLEHDAWWGYNHFFSRMFEIWKLYKRYGETVLKVDFEEGDEKFKSLFTKSEDEKQFKENVKKHWKQNYHFVANNYEELFNLFSDYKQRKNEKGHLSLLPEEGDYREGENKGYEQTYSIKKSLFDEIVAKTKAANLREIMLINKKEERVLVIRISTRTTGSYDEIIVSECKESDTIII